MNKQTHVAIRNSSVDDLHKKLSRSMFDQLLERDLLGTLLSSNHFKLALRNIALKTEHHELEILQEILIDDVKVLGFHQLMLSMYAGIYIKECKHEDLARLMLDLDNKYTENDSTSFSFSEICPFQINHVALDWRYRRQCAVDQSVYQ